MPVPLIPCRNKVTGAFAEIPETALPHLSDYEPIEADGQAETAPAPDAAPEPAEQTARPAPKPKARAAKTEGE